ncbi:hypothetical protein DRW07_09225 [Alteromonas sediminis]|uniref:Phytase-like domain-containing protein n=1 Tax=Alteromonas sediminis TaxID=2259342 RepID=A0A3N5ZA74_9ALTE|nr:hypothetical protein [Alteromonas sediminis]RPJ66268.1 hypothetical protein DRW07_09225 [Alteromonas sediminis]
MYKSSFWAFFILCFFASAACSDQPVQSAEVVAQPEQKANLLVGKWIRESDGTVMPDPQTSGLAHWRGQLLSLSDGSATESQRRRIHFIDPDSAYLAPKTNTIKMASRVRRSCFAQYLSDQPDLEALVVDPDDDTVMYMVTEDATRTGALSSRCQQRFAQTGSTAYPTLLVRLKVNENSDVTMTHVRPVQFPIEAEVGDFPNDGIEGLAMSADRVLFLGLEKDKAGKARIFSTAITADFWDDSDFIAVKDANLRLPLLNGENHPINGLTWYAPHSESPGFILAAARNDDELWVIDVSGKREPKRIMLNFAAEISEPSLDCGDHEIMDNASIEGLAVIGSQLWLVNDPWKRHYKKNTQCKTNAPHYATMSPLLFSMPLESDWFE